MTFFRSIINFFNRFKIPTILGLSIIFTGTIAGVYLVMREQVFSSQAAPNIVPQNITISNITDDSVTISWETSQPTISFISFGQNSPDERTALDDRDENPPAGGPKSHSIHYVTLKNLLPDTQYQFDIVLGKKTNSISQFKTAQPLNSQKEFTPIIGSVEDGDEPLIEGIAYLSIAGAVTESALIKNGNFLIPLSQIRKEDLTDIFPLTEETISKLTIVSEKGNTSILFKLTSSLPPLPPLKLGQDIDLTLASPSAEEISKFDLNGDGQINAADNAIILNNIGTKPKDNRGDLNKDGVVDQKDVDLMSPHINQ